MPWRSHLSDFGYVLLPGLLPREDCEVWLRRWNQFLDETPTATVLKTSGGAIYGARNLIREWPDIAGLAMLPALRDSILAVLGPKAGLVRVLYFDKPPDQSWSLPWHKDLNIAVKDNRLQSDAFKHPTVKHGVPHVEAPAEVLEKMLTARIHLDAATISNGPLKVLPGSHRTESVTNAPVAILCESGDVLLMRPLLSHASGDSLPGTTEHRRLFHLEFAAAPELADGFEWFDFVALE